MTTVNKCPECSMVLLRAGACPNCSPDPFKFGPPKSVPKQECHFSGDGKCKHGTSIRINDSWLCEWHYGMGYDKSLREKSA